MLETQRNRRGHAFTPPKAVLRKIPALYATEPIALPDKTIWAHYFAAGSDYWIAELDQETWTAWGYAKHANQPEGAEWGFIALWELERIRASGVVNGQRFPGLVIVERDMHWTPCKFGEIKEAQK